MEWLTETFVSFNALPRGIFENNGQIFISADIDGVLSMKLNRFKRGGQEFFKVDFLQTQFNIGGAKVRLDNLFNGRDKELAASMNQFINENWRMVAAEVRPTLERIISEQLSEVADKFFNAFPISKLFVS